MLPLYERIDTLCKENGTNITQMCKAAGVQRSALSDFKSGKNKTISFSNLQKIADYFNMTVDELVNGNSKKSLNISSEDEEISEMIEELKNNPGKRLLFSKTKKATKADIEKIIAMVDILTGGNDDGKYYD